MMKSIKLWALAGIFAFLALAIVWICDYLMLFAPFLIIISGIIAYYALKAERREEQNGIPNETDKGQVEA